MVSVKLCFVALTFLNSTCAFPNSFFFHICLGSFGHCGRVNLEVSVEGLQLVPISLSTGSVSVVVWLTVYLPLLDRAAFSRFCPLQVLIWNGRAGDT